MFDRRNADAKLGPDLFVRETTAEQLQYLAFSSRQSGVAFRFFALRLATKQRAQQTRRNVRRADEPSGDDLMDRAAELIDGGIPRNIARISRTSAGDDLVPLFVETQSDQRNIGPLCRDRTDVEEIDPERDVYQDGLSITCVDNFPEVGKIPDNRDRGKVRPAAKAGG